MFNFYKKDKIQKLLYSKIVLLSRNRLFYENFNLADSFQNRINLIFLHVSFIFIKVKNEKKKSVFKDFYQPMFDLTFRNIELNMREIGYGDVSVNKNMKILVKNFYNILLNCENFNKVPKNVLESFFNTYLDNKSNKEKLNIAGLIDYFIKYEAFCFDLGSDSVLKGDLNFKYK
jgi:cytochrome b pre-mRNA-processing protein 3